MPAELLHEIWLEIAEKPVPFIAEVVQFGLLIVIVWIFAIGLGKRPGFVKNMLRERKKRVASEISAAESAADRLAAATREAESTIDGARREAERLLSEAEQESRKEIAEAKKAADAEAEAMIEHARQVLEIERAEMLAEARERLLDVVVRSTRQILNEGLSPAEQRALIQASIVASLGGDGAKAPSEATR